ncbi:MAG: amine oxidase, partial [Actinomycetota bacterium]|nr:amine oxidase [Actinomycetota bacterium]
LYLVLRQRGVDFQFFQRATRVRVASDDPHLIEAIEFDRQVPDAGDYQPLVTVKGRPCWPARPLLDIDDPSSLEESVIDAPHDPWVLDVGPTDKVVLGIPIGVLPTLCADLIKDHPEWKWMVDRVETVATQAFQLWLGEGFGELGAAGSRVRPDDVAENLRFLTSGGYVEPFDTWADMSHLIDVEDFPDAHRPRAIAYLCNVLPGVDPGKRQCQSDWDRVVKRNAERFLRHHALHIWPGAVSRYPDEFRWDLLVDPSGGVGHERFDAQFFRANVDPSERYVLSVPGSGRTRLAPDESGYENLFLAGDWTRCGLDLGCVEAAVMSGMLAAAAVENADVHHVIGAGHL